MISTRQINAVELNNFIEASISGAAFSGILIAYVNASGYLGPTVAYLSGGSQTLLGNYTFINPITVPYTGTSGQSVAKKYLDDSIASINTNLSGWATGSLVSLFFDQLISGAKSFTGNVGVGFALRSGDAVQFFQFTGASGVLQAAINGVTISNVVYQTGDQTVQGFKLFTGSPWVADPTAPSGVVNLKYLTGVSGALAANGGGVGTGYSGYVENTFVHRGTIDETISGFKIFTGSPWVADPTQPSGAVNLEYLTGVSGALFAQITGSGIAGPSGASGASGASIIGPSGVMGPAGSGIYFVNSGTITGNFVNLSFFLDPISTGLNIFESFVAETFYFTGAAFACRTSGYGPVKGGILTGLIYQVNQLNVETVLYNFTFTSGVIYSGSPAFASLVTGNNRIGLSITNSLSGIQKFCVGIYGGNYV